MSEERIRRELTAAVADEPPLRLGPDGIVARARQGRQRRLARLSMLATAVATILIAAGAGLLPPMAGAGGGSKTPAVVPSPSLWRAGPEEAYGRDEYRAVTRAVLTRIPDAFGATVPEAKVLPAHNAASYRPGAAHQNWHVDAEFVTQSGKHEISFTATRKTAGRYEKNCYEEPRRITRCTALAPRPGLGSGWFKSSDLRTYGWTVTFTPDAHLTIGLWVRGEDEPSPLAEEQMIDLVEAVLT
ncbi:hypothetical protein [Streptomyces sp. NPDC004134]|uniref:hypothetical protein n=1 Tax=Streptomyces sp. NPDC004134 TaxID=3364691 RepID=UPI0036A3F173